MGEAAAIMFAQAGAAAVVADINEAAAKSVTEKITPKGQKVIAVRCDVTDAQQVKDMVDKAIETYGRLDAAFNNAGQAIAVDGGFTIVKIASAKKRSGVSVTLQNETGTRM